MRRRKFLAVLGVATAGAVLLHEAYGSGGVPLPFFSQNDSRWACTQFGTCSGTTIGECSGKTPGGCLVTCIAMALRGKGAGVDPAQLNSWLINNGGYDSGCFVKCSRAADYDGSGGLTWVGNGSLVSPGDLRSKIDQGRRVIAKSTRYSSHWGAIRGYLNDGSKWSDFLYWDPRDNPAISRILGDGFISQGAETREFR
jgi:hypothetical protein